MVDGRAVRTTLGEDDAQNDVLEAQNREQNVVVVALIVALHFIGITINVGFVPMLALQQENSEQLESSDQNYLQKYGHELRNAHQRGWGTYGRQVLVRLVPTDCKRRNMSCNQRTSQTRPSLHRNIKTEIMATSWNKFCMSVRAESN